MNLERLLPKWPYNLSVAVNLVLVVTLLCSFAATQILANETMWSQKFSFLPRCFIDIQHAHFYQCDNKIYMTHSVHCLEITVKVGLVLNTNS